MSGLNALDPVVAQAEQQIARQKLPPDKAVDYLLSKGVDPRLASLVMKYRTLKQAAGNAPQQAPVKTVSQDIDEQINTMAAQRNKGVAGLPVPNNTFGMAGGGIIAFDGGGMTVPTDPTDMAAMQQQQLYQNIMDQQAQQQSGKAGGGIVAFEEGGEADEESLARQQGAISQYLMKNYWRDAAGNYLAKGRQKQSQMGIAPQRKGGKIEHFDEGGVNPYSAAYATDPQFQAPRIPNIPVAHASGPIPEDIKYELDMHQTRNTPLTPRAQAYLAGNAPPQKVPAAGQQNAGVTPPPPSPTGQPPGSPQFGPNQNQIPAGVPSPPPQPAPSPQPNMEMSMSGRAGMGMHVPVDPRTGEPIVEKEAIAQQQAAFEASAPKSIEENLHTIQALNASQGIGTAAKQYMGFLDKFGSEIEGFKKQGNWLALAKAGFAMAEAATINPHGGFIGALAVGGHAGAEAYEENLNKYRDLNMQLQGQKYNVAQSIENLKMGQTNEAMNLFLKQQERHDALQGRMWTAQDNMLSRVLQRQIASETIAAQARYRSMYNPAQLFAEQIIDTPKKLSDGSPNPAYQNVLDKAHDYYSTQPSVLAAETRTGPANTAVLERLFTSPSYQMAYNRSLSSNSKTAQEGSDEMVRLETKVTGKGADFTPPPGFNADLFKVSGP